MPTKEADFIDWSENLLAVFIAHKDEWHLDQSKLEEVFVRNNLQNNDAMTDNGRAELGIPIHSKTHSPLELTFDEDQRGKRLYFAVAGRAARLRKDCGAIFTTRLSRRE
jgi:hypothetical protein